MNHLPGRRRNEVVAPHRFEQFIEKRQRVFVNRNLRMSSIRWVGFDMDHTLALYNRNFIEALAFDMAKEALIRDRSYPRELEGIRYDPNFGIRGLVVDKERGNILKMDKFHYVAAAYHGKRILDKESRKRVYHTHKIQLSSPRYWSNDTLFGLPEIALYAGVVQALEEAGWPAGLSYQNLFDDIRYCVDLVHKDGSLKNIILSRMSECFLRDPKLPYALEKYRREGLRLFLLTNSSFDYTDQVLEYVLRDPFLDRSWRSYFDLIICDAKKPDFFLKRLRWKSSQVGDGLTVYNGGNFRLLEQAMGAQGDEILYIGDHIYGDILRSKKHSGWRTAMIIEELDHEIRASEQNESSHLRLDTIQIENGELINRLLEFRRDLEQLRSQKISNYKSLNGAKLEDLDRRISELSQRCGELDEQLTANILEIKDIEKQSNMRFNPYWGSLIKVDNELSRFGDQVKDFACLYTSRVSNFLFYPQDRYFRSPVEFLPHEI